MLRPAESHSCLLQALSVSEYSNVLLQKYLRQSFGPSRQENLSVAAEELYGGCPEVPVDARVRPFRSKVD